MESQQEPSVEPQAPEAPPQDQSQAPESEIPLLPESPADLLPESPGSDDIDLEIAAAGGEPETPPPVETPVDAPPVEAPVADPEAWASFDSIDVEAVPEAAKPFVTRLMLLAETELSVRQQALDDEKARFTSVIESLEQGDTSQAMEQFTELQTRLTSQETMLNDAVYDAFSARNPRYPELAEEVKGEFADMLQENRHEAMFPGESRVQQLERTLQYVCYRNKVAWPPAAEPSSDEAAGQALVADGTGSTNIPHTPVDQKSFDEILHGPEAAGFLENHFNSRV